jgi:hypothetical protein
MERDRLVICTLVVENIIHSTGIPMMTEEEEATANAVLDDPSYDQEGP